MYSKTILLVNLSLEEIIYDILKFRNVESYVIDECMCCEAG